MNIDNGAIRFFLVSLCSLLLINCASLNHTQSAKTIKPIPTANKVDLKQTSQVLEKLQQQHQEWQGTPYQFGGLSKQGVDCSGFVHQTFKSKLGYILPRTTKQQSQVGKAIKITQLKAGDLVFFKTGWNTRHVGIYVSQGQFLHASKSKGVIYSKLNNIYWNDNYWKAVRLE